MTYYLPQGWLGEETGDDESDGAGAEGSGSEGDSQQEEQSAPVAKVEAKDAETLQKWQEGGAELKKAMDESLGDGVLDMLQDHLDEYLKGQGLPPSPRPLSWDSMKEYMLAVGKSRLRDVIYAKYGIDINDVFDENGDVDWIRVLFMIAQVLTGIDGYDLYVAIRDGDTYPIVKESVGVTAGAVCYIIGGPETASNCQAGAELVFEAGEYVVEAVVWVYEKAAELFKDAYCYFVDCEEPPPETDIVLIRPDTNVIVSLLAKWYASYSPDRLLNLGKLRALALNILAVAEKFAVLFERETGQKMTVNEALKALERNGLNTLDNRLWLLVGSRPSAQMANYLRIDEWEFAARVLFQPTGDETSETPWLTRYDDWAWLSSDDVLRYRWAANTDALVADFSIAPAVQGVWEGNAVNEPPWVRFQAPRAMSGAGPVPAVDLPEGWVYEPNMIWSEHVTRTTNGVCENGRLAPNPGDNPTVIPWPSNLGGAMPCGHPNWSQTPQDAVAYIDVRPGLDTIVRSNPGTESAVAIVTASINYALKKAAAELNLAVSLAARPGAEPLTAKSFADTAPEKPKPASLEDQKRVADMVSSGDEEEYEPLPTGVKVAVAASFLASGWVFWRVYSKQPLWPGGPRSQRS